MSEESFRFRRGSASVAVLNAAVQAVLADPELAGRADVPDRIDISEEGQGFDPFTVAIVVVLIRFGGHVATNVWDDVIWPRVRRKLDDDDALGERLDA